MCLHCSAGHSAALFVMWSLGMALLSGDALTGHCSFALSGELPVKILNCGGNT